jgi:hypothetical protein
MLAYIAMMTVLIMFLFVPLRSTLEKGFVILWELYAAVQAIVLLEAHVILRIVTRAAAFSRLQSVRMELDVVLPILTQEKCIT